MQLLDTTGFDGVSCLNGDLTPEKLQKHLQQMSGFDDGKPAKMPPPVIVGRSPVMQKIRKLIREIGPSMAPVLVTGEKGTGKDLVAQAIHYEPNNPGSRLVKIDVPAFIAERDDLPAQWVPQKLDSVSDATTATSGTLPAKRMTVLIDGIDHLPLEHQERFVAFLAENSPNGTGNSISSSGIRLICASRKNIAALAEAGRFRKDLYHLLSVFAIEIPPLRIRTEDILLLADYFDGVCCLALSRTALDISGGAREMLLAHSWPGNVAELRQLIFDAFSSQDEDYLHRSLEKAIGNTSGIDADSCSAEAVNDCAALADHKGQTLSLKHACKSIVEKTEKKFIAEALDRTNWNRRRAARILDVSYRTLLNKIKTYDIR
jgi:DNA-binding NtrC family response regulator